MGSSDRSAAGPQSTPRLKKLLKSKGVLVKSKEGIVTIAVGLPDDEVRHKYALVKEALLESG